MCVAIAFIHNHIPKPLVFFNKKIAYERYINNLCLIATGQGGEEDDRKMHMLTCAVCGAPLRPEEAGRCEECGRIVGKEHLHYHNGRWICTECLKRELARERSYGADKHRELALEIAIAGI
jgi:hypothetical protein